MTPLLCGTCLRNSFQRRVKLRSRVWRDTCFSSTACRVLTGQASSIGVSSCTLRVWRDTGDSFPFAQLSHSGNHTRNTQDLAQAEMLKSDDTKRCAEHTRHTTSMDVEWSDLSRTNSVRVLRHCWHTMNFREYSRSDMMSFSRTLLRPIRMRIAAPCCPQRVQRRPPATKKAMRCPGSRPSLPATEAKFSQMV